MSPCLQFWSWLHELDSRETSTQEDSEDADEVKEEQGQICSLDHLRINFFSNRSLGTSKMQLELVLRRCVGGGSRFRVELVVADELLLNNRFTFSSLNHFFASAFPAVPLSSSKKYRSAIPIERSRTISCVYDVSRRWRWRWRWRRRFEFARSSAVPKRKVRREIVRLVPGRPSVAPRS